jgi:CRP-like cAMP-binding protein
MSRRQGIKAEGLMLAVARNGWPRGNLILSAVPAGERDRWLAHLGTVELRGGQTLYRAADRMSWLYFPLDSIVATLGVNRKGGTAEYVLIGNEGFIGLNAFLGDSRAGGDAIVLLPGSAYRLPAAPLSEAFERSQALRSVVLRYAASRVFQTSQTSLCNAHHSMEQRLCRWLLQTLDRMTSTELRITHELLGMAHGVRREAVTHAATRLQQQGAIHCGRGSITVLDRSRLEGLCCECYAELKQDLKLMASDICRI